MCKCMCRNCTVKSKRSFKSIGTQTEWKRHVKAIQTKPKVVSIGISCVPRICDTAIQVSAVMCETGVNTMPQDKPVPVDTTGIEPPCQGFPTDIIHGENDKDSDDELKDLAKDPTYVPPQPMKARHSGLPENTDIENKYLVFQSSLDHLFAHCPQCGADTTSHHFDSGNYGTLVMVHYTCVRGHSDVWLSQPILKHRMAAGNLLLCAAILLTGATFERFREIAEVIHLSFMSESTFYSIQEKYLIPVIHTYYTQQKEAIIAYLGGDDRTMVGDGRCDTPGFSAKYGTYSIMDSQTNVIVTFSLKQVKEDVSSVELEALGCYDALTELLHHHVILKVFGTDSSTSVAKVLRECFPEISHDRDVYHVEKRIKKLLVQKANQRGNNILFAWIKPILNQLWWAAQNCNENKTELREKWISIMYHITDQHQWDLFDIYHECAHAPLTEEQRRIKKWLPPDSAPHKALKQVLLDPKIVEDVERLTHAVHTGGLESFHSLITKYLPKRQHFSYKGMVVRTELAILDHNSHLGRAQATTKEGIPCFRTVFPKRTKEWVAKPISEPKKHMWRQELLHEVVTYQRGERTVIYVDIPEDVPENIADTPRPEKEEIISRHRSRFQKQSS